MDNTLDSIRPSDCVNRDEMSYLFGRDPSIIACGQRPQMHHDAKKNLLSLYGVEECSTVEENTSSSTIPDYLQTVKVYLRMKPFPRKIKLSSIQEEAYSITSSTTLLTRLPALDNNTSYLNKTKGSGTVCRKYVFTKTFGPETTQLELFDQAVRQKMEDFLAGHNCTVMTYGTTNSGKSYTLQGTIASPGIIPRALEFVFSNITPKTTPSYKPAHNNDVIALDACQRMQELDEKAKLLTFGSTDKNQYINAYKQMQQLLQEESPLRRSQYTDAYFSVWVSFAEIYNETIYDLLANECQKKKAPLKLATDSEGRAFIKGLKMVCVNSGSEAYQILMAGQYNLKVAATALNARSSRSHCIFTIKLLKYHIENLPDSVEVSTFAFCDLAGSERLKKTLNVGDRLKEAQNINTSLLVLGKCLKYIYEGQSFKQKNEIIGPFRESKLTRLFQMALSGKEHLALIVNVNPVPNLYVETQNVLTFSAIAKRIVVEPTKVAKRKSKSRFSQAIAQSIKTVTDWDSADLVNIDEETTDTEDTQVNDDDIYDKLMDENENLKKELATVKSNMLEHDMRIRQEMADKYSAIIKQIEEGWKNRVKNFEALQEDTLESTVRQVEEFYEQKISQLNLQKRPKNDYDDEDFVEDDKKIIDELQSENSYLTSKVDSLKDIIRKLKDENKSLHVEKNQVSFECNLLKHELRSTKDLLKASRGGETDEERSYIEKLELQLSTERDRTRKLKLLLNDAKEEYIEITTDAREKEEKIKELEDTIVEHLEHIDELETDLENANVCLTAKTKSIEVLEDRLELRTRKLSDVESKLQALQRKISELEQQEDKGSGEESGESALRSMEKKINELESELRERSDRLLEAENKLQSTEKEMRELEGEKQSLLDQVRDLSENKIVKEENLSNIEDYQEIMKQKTLRMDDREEVERKMLDIQAENSNLKERLGRSAEEIRSLREALDEAKDQLVHISEQLSDFKSNVQLQTVKDEMDIAEVGCQTEIASVVGEKKAMSDCGCQTASIARDTNDLACQTASAETKEQINQTSFVGSLMEDQYAQTSVLVNEDDERETERELAAATAKYDELEQRYQGECSRVQELTNELCRLQEKMESLTDVSSTQSFEIEEYKTSVATLRDDLKSIKRQKDDFEEELRKVRNARDRLQQQNDEHIQQYEAKINALEKELCRATEKSEMKAHCIEAHEERILELEQKINSIQELQDMIAEQNEKMETCRREKEDLQRLLDENNCALDQYKAQLDKAHCKEQEKDDEIEKLQREIKHVIRSSDGGDRIHEMEVEMKRVLQELAGTREEVERKNEQIRSLESRQSAVEQNAKIVELLERSARDRQAENDRLRNINEELQKGLMAKDCEMESFRKNRDETITKYEALVKSQQEELEREKREVMRYQELFRRQTTPTPSKDETKKLKSQIKELEEKLKRYENCSKGKENMNVSDDDVSLGERRGRGRKKRENFLSPNRLADEIQVVELSGSESKYTTRRTALAPPNAELSTEKRKATRKKKLFNQMNDSLEDIEPLESTQISGRLPSPSSVHRNLRSRRK